MPPESPDRRKTLDPETTTVHEALGEIPGAGDVFRRFGIDTCCGGELSLAATAEHHDVELDRLMGELARVGSDDRGFGGGA